MLTHLDQVNNSGEDAIIAAYGNICEAVGRTQLIHDDLKNRP
jgi:hypothetical protein